MSRSKRPFRNGGGRHAIPEDHHPQPQGNARLSEEETIVKDKMSAEEREILDGFDRGELRSASETKRELQVARQAARNTFNKTRRETRRESPHEG